MAAIGAPLGAGVAYLMKGYADEIKKTGNKDIPFADYVFDRVGIEPGLIDSGDIDAVMNKAAELPQDVKGLIMNLFEEKDFNKAFEK